MSFINRFKHNIIAVAIFLVISFVFCKPVLEGSKLRSTDLLSWEYFSHEATSYADSTGKLVTWTNSQFGGMPTYFIYLNSHSNFIGEVYYLISNVLLPKPVYLLFISMMCFFILFRTYKLDNWLSILASIAGTLASYNFILLRVTHESKLLTTALFPGILAGILLMYQGKTWKSILVLIFTLGFSLSMGMQQLEYYMIFIIGFMAISEFLKYKKEKLLPDFIKKSIYLIGIAVVCFLPNALGLLPLYEYNKTTMRGGLSELTLNKDKKDLNKKNGGLDKDYAFQWDQGWGETMTGIVPMLYGGASGEKLSETSNLSEKLTELGVQSNQVSQFIDHAPTYWGEQPFVMGPVYFGVVIVFLFIFAMFYIREKYKYWILAAIIFTILISLGDNFKTINYILFDNLPLFNKFRTHSMILSLTEPLLAFLAFLGLNKLINDTQLNKTQTTKYLYISAGLIAFFLLLVILAPSAFFNFTSTNDEGLLQQFTQSFQNAEAAKSVLGALIKDRQDMAVNSAIQSLFFLLLAAGSIWAFLNNKISGKIISYIVAVVAIIDLTSVAVNYFNSDDFMDKDEYAMNFTPRKVDEMILQDKDPYYRVLDLTVNTYNDSKPAYFHKNVGGYSPAKMESYQDLIDLYMGGKQSEGKFNTAVLSMLNTKYVILGQPGNEQAMPIPTALGNGWFVSKLDWRKSADEEMLAMKSTNLGDSISVSNAFDAGVTAVIRDDKNAESLKKYTFGKDTNAKIKLNTYGLMDLDYTSQNSQPGFAVFSDIYYDKGWKAYVDDKETPIYRVNYLLRGIQVPEGNHHIVFKFRPTVVSKSITIAWIGSILILILFVIAVYFEYFKKKKSIAIEK